MLRSSSKISKVKHKKIHVSLGQQLQYGLVGGGNIPHYAGKITPSYSFTSGGSRPSWLWGEASWGPLSNYSDTHHFCLKLCSEESLPNDKGAGPCRRLESSCLVSGIHTDISTN